MADRYWFGGTGTWNTSSTTQWSAANPLSFTASCSGTTLTTTGSPALAIGMTVRAANNTSLGTITAGANPTWTVSIGGTFASQTMKAATVGASVPTVADNVNFTSNSSGTTAYTVTMTGAITCLDFNTTGLTPTFATGTSPTLNVRGSMTLVAGTVWNSTGTITFSAVATGKVVTTNGTSLSAAVAFNGVGGGWTLGSALSATGGMTITAGALNTSTANSYALTCATITATSASTSSLTLNASTVTLTGGTSTFNGTGFTLSAGTSQINFTSTSPALTGPNTFYNVAFTAVAAGAVLGISGSNTFNNLSINAPTATGLVKVQFTDDQTVNGTLTGSGSTPVQRVYYRSSVVGTTRTLTLASPVTLSNVDFRDIAATSTITATTSGGDCGGNSGITFSTPKTVYWNLAGTQNWSATGWATTSTGTPALANFPLAQDTAIFTDSGAAGTVSMEVDWHLGTVDMSGRTSAMTLNRNSGIATAGIYGSWYNGSGVTLTGTDALAFLGRGNTQQIGGNGVTFTFPITANNLGGSVQLASAFTATVGFSFATGTLDLQSYTLTAASFTSNNANTRTLAFGTGSIVLTGSGNVWGTNTTTGLTTTSSSSAATISLTSATAKTFASSGGGVFNCTLNQGGVGSLIITGSNTFANITNTVQPTTIRFTEGTTTTFGDFSLSGTAGNLVTVRSVSPSATHTLSKASGTVSCDYLSVTTSIATGGAAWYAGANSTDGGGNTGWTFAAAPTGSVTVNATGVAATGAVGTSVIQAKANAPTTGPPATGYVGDVFVALPASVTLTGVEAAGSVGSVTVVAKANVTLTGVEATGSVGTAMVATLVFVTGVEATGSVGTVVVAAKANADVTGVSASGSVGTATVTAPVNVTLTGVEAIGSVGSVTVYAAANDNPTGVEATGSVGTVEVAAQASITLTSVSASGAMGTVTTQSAYRVTGVSATGAVGTVSVGIAQRFSVTGVSATGYVSSVNVWSVINDNQTPDWVPVDDTQSGSWTQIVDGNTVVWTDIPT